MGDTLRYWQAARQMEKFIDEYAAGRLDDAANTLGKMEMK
jgi:hypothetical protein